MVISDHQSIYLYLKQLKAKGMIGAVYVKTKLRILISIDSAIGVE